MARKKKEDKEYLEPQEASKIVNGGDPPYKVPEENGNGNGNGDRGSKEAQLLSSTAEAIALRKAEIKGQIKLEKNRHSMEIAKIKALETGREKSKKHLAQFAGLYLTILVALFLYATQSLNAEALAVVASIISIVIVNLSAIMKSVVEEEEPRDPTEMAMDLLDKTIVLEHEEKN
tara:strand:- start:42 stop:566 length:525 start_codon:yes stop_codon:yes gene_type:complete